MPSITSLTLKATPAGTEEIPVNDAGADRKVTVAAIRQPATDHIGNTSNPHAVTKSQVGLGNCDNTSDANKPVSAPQAAALAPKGLLSASGLTLPGTGLAGRQSAGAGPLQLITIGAGLDLTGGVLSAPPGVNLVNERFTEVDTVSTDTDYGIILTGTTTRTLTLAAGAAVGKEIAAACQTSSSLADLIVTGVVGGSIRLPSGCGAVFLKTTIGWVPISERRLRRIRAFDDSSTSTHDLPPDCVHAIVTNSNASTPLVLNLLPPTEHTEHPVALQNLGGSLGILQVDGHLDGVSAASVQVYPGETLIIVPATTTWRTVSGPIAPQYRQLANNVANSNAVANTLADLPELGFPVFAGANYQFRFVIHYNAAATTTGCRFTVNGPSASVISYTSRYPLTATTETVNHGLNAYNLPAAANASSLTTGNVAIIEGLVSFTSSGTFLPRFASEVASSAITARPGSTGELRRVP